MNRIFLDVHALQTVPPSNVNRDDTGALTGCGVRGSAACPGIQSGLEAGGPYLLRRRAPAGCEQARGGTKKIVEAVADRITALDPSVGSEAAMRIADETVKPQA